MKTNIKLPRKPKRDWSYGLKAVITRAVKKQVSLRNAEEQERKYPTKATAYYDKHLGWLVNFPEGMYDGLPTKKVAERLADKFNRFGAKEADRFFKQVVKMLKWPLRELNLSAHHCRGDERIVAMAILVKRQLDKGERNGVIQKGAR